MDVKKNVYERFYWKFQSIMVDSEFSNNWSDTCRSKKSEKHWAVIKKGELVGLGTALSGREARYFYRFMTDYKLKELTTQNFPDEIAVKALKYCGAYLSPLIISKYDLRERDIARILFQFFFEHYDAAFLKTEPSLIVFDIDGYKKIDYKPDGSNLISDNQITNVQNSKKNLLTEKKDALWLQALTPISKNVERILSLKEHSKQISERAESFFMHISNDKANSYHWLNAFEYWDSWKRQTNWKGNCELFEAFWNIYISIENFKIVEAKVEFKYSHCICFFESTSLRDLQKVGKQILNLAELDELYYSSLDKMDSDGEYNNSRELYEKFNRNRIERYTNLPDTLISIHSKYQTVKAYNLFRLKFKLVGNVWFITHAEPLKSNTYSSENEIMMDEHFSSLYDSPGRPNIFDKIFEERYNRLRKK